MSFVLGRGGMLRGRWRAAAAYHRPDFHPWRHLDNRRFLSELREAVVDPQWELKAGAGLPENLESKTGSPQGRPEDPTTVDLRHAVRRTTLDLDVPRRNPCDQPIKTGCEV